MNLPKELLDLLRFHQSTQGLDDRQLKRLAEEAEIVTFSKGDVVHHARALMDGLSLVIHGRLGLNVVSPSGVEQPLHYVGRDEQLGLLALSQEEPFPISVVAQEQSTLLRIRREAAVTLLQELPVWHRNLLRSVGLKLRETVLREKRRKTARVVTFVHWSDTDRDLVPRIVRQLTSWGERVGLLSDRPETVSAAPGPSASLLDSAGQHLNPEQVRQVVGGWPDVERVFVDARLDRAANHLDASVAASAQVYWIGPSDIGQNALSALESVTDRLPGTEDKTFVMRVLKRQEQVAAYMPQLRPLCQREFLLPWDAAAETPTSSQPWDRLLHHFRGVSIGLALGGGAARGMAHLGVLQVLQQAGITVDRMSGTSAGALTGIMYAAGYDPEFMIESFARDLKPGWPYRWLPYGDYCYMLGKYRLGRWDGMLRKYLHDWRLEQLPIPFSSVAVDLVRAEQVVRDRGDAVHALLESINLPAVSAPICRSGKVLVDGGVLNVVPADVLANQGATVVVAVDVASNISQQFAGNRPDTPDERMKVPNIFQTTGRVRTVQDRNIRSLGATTADLTVEPDVSQVRVSDFQRAPQIAELGRTAMEAALPQLREILHATDPPVFSRL